MTSEARLTTIKQRDRAQRLVRRATAIAALGAAVGGAVLTIDLGAPRAHTSAATRTTSSETDDGQTSVAPSTTSTQGSAARSGGS